MFVCFSVFCLIPALFFDTFSFMCVYCFESCRLLVRQRDSLRRIVNNLNVLTFFFVYYFQQGEDWLLFFWNSRRTHTYTRLWKRSNDLFFHYYTHRTRIRWECLWTYVPITYWKSCISLFQHPFCCFCFMFFFSRKLYSP